MEYLVAKWLHVLSSTLLFGTGLGSAYLHVLRQPHARSARGRPVVRLVVRADGWFTTTTIVFQPLSGLYMMHLVGLPLSTPWIAWSFALYFLAGACWLPVVWMQIRMRELAERAVREGTPLPPLYFRYFRYWTMLGFPAFFAFVAVFWLMVAKPA